MTEIAELERRITAALERIGLGLDALARSAGPVTAQAEPDGPPPDLSALQDALAAESETNARLTERLEIAAQREAAALAARDAALAGESTAQSLLTGVTEREAKVTAALEAQIGRLTRQLDTQGLELQRMRQTVIQLREALRSLRETEGAGLADSGLLNKAMQTELEALRATRLTEMAEIDEILAELRPLLAEVQNA